MKTLLTLLFLSLSLPLAGVAVGQINHVYNEVGIYAVPDPDGCASAQIDIAPLTGFQCYVVLTNPWNDDLDRPVSTIGFINLYLPPPDGVWLLGATMPPLSTWDCWDCPLGYLWFPVDCTVTGQSVVLTTLTMLVEGPGPYLLFMSPPPPGFGSEFPGEMTYYETDGDHPVHVMDPVSGSFDVPVFAINWDGDLSFCETVPDEGTSFGSLKALYR